MLSTLLPPKCDESSLRSKEMSRNLVRVVGNRIGRLKTTRISIQRCLTRRFRRNFFGRSQGISGRREGVRERTNRRECSTNIEFFDCKQQTFGHSGSKNEVLAPTVKMFDFHKQTLLANVLSSLNRFSTPQNAKFVVEMFDPTLRSILESVVQSKPIPGLDFS